MTDPRTFHLEYVGHQGWDWIIVDDDGERIDGKYTSYQAGLEALSQMISDYLTAEKYQGINQ